MVAVVVVNSQRVTWEPLREFWPPPSSPKGEDSFLFVVVLFLDGYGTEHRSPQERLAFVPGARTPASSLSLGKDNDCFWRELAVRATGDSNRTFWRWVSCGNKLGPGPLSCNRNCWPIGAGGLSKVDPIDAQLTKPPRLMGWWLTLLPPSPVYSHFFDHGQPDLPSN
jgi:hypothetical protein